MTKRQYKEFLVDDSYKSLSRSPIPILSLDTHIISNMAKWKQGYRLDSISRNRAKELYDMIYKLTREKKLLCPILDIHETECALDSRLSKIAKEVIIQLSAGIKFKHRQRIENWQTAMAMRAFIKKEDKIDYQSKWLHIFSNDPIVELAREKPFIVSVSRDYSDEEIDKMRYQKEALRQELIRIKEKEKNVKISFDKQLEREYEGHLFGILKLGANMLTYILKGQIPSIEAFMGYLNLGLPLTWWKEYNGKPEGLPGLSTFYRSKQFKEIPFIEIKCKLNAALATYNKDDIPKLSDWIDVGMISSILPYAHFIILDKTMANLITQKLRLDKKYNAKIFSPKQHNLLMEELNEISQKPSPLNNYAS
ncbi:MAG: hypothetical protein US89_C0022G0005 [Candidatus Peregrinibacteria bacterium GW2011_GWF2_38_29]|nr:MAG: hypothetical protein US89_C0022G0005 [Candidatus Peregrinibacteria bacterium GW2011_GWF2_38_29]